MKSYTQWGRLGAVLVFGLAACEVLIMISPFAGFFYASLHYQPFLGFLSATPLTAWLDGFFLNHSVVTTSWLLETQRTLGRYLFALGLWGFLVSAAQVYGNKIRRRGVATGLLYRFSRHPQYLSLGVAGAGLLTIWPRFLLLGLWVTMLFLYAGLARFEEARMEERFGEKYREYARGKGAFLPGSPVRRVFEATFGKIHPRPVAWLSAYLVSLALVFLAGAGLRSFTRSSTVTVVEPQAKTVVISAWPQSSTWARKVVEVARSAPEVESRLHGEAPLVATILPPHYVMKGMFYLMPSSGDKVPRRASRLKALVRIAAFVLLPWVRPPDFMGVDPQKTNEPVQVVFSRAEKPFKQHLELAEALDASVRLTPLAVVDVDSRQGSVVRVGTPLPQNRWGPQVVMPIF